MKKGFKILLIGIVVSALCAISILCTACVPTGQWEVTLTYDTTRGRVDLVPYEEDMIYFEGTEITVTVTPNSDCKVDKVYLNGTLQTLEGNKFNFTIIENTEIRVEFVRMNGDEE